MIKKILDLHIHSKYSRACSPELELPKIARVCAQKGVDIVATGDFTHPVWFKHIEESLEEIRNTGIYQLKNNTSSKTKFILGTEISCIYKHKEKTRRLHLVILAPNIEAVRKFNIVLENRGVNLKADGRPIMGLTGKQILQILLDIDERFMIIPAHAWTPWFAVFGSKSGYDSLKDCFEELTPHIRAIETGLSSDPIMNRRLSALDKITLVSNSDAHSLENLGREANVLAFKSERQVTYDNILEIIKTGDKNKFLYTIEFYPEEGKYYFDGHLTCEYWSDPKETKKKKGVCPECKKQMTIGVLHRVDDLADREEKNIPWKKFVSYKYIVPLKEVIGKVFGVGIKTKKVQKEYDRLISNLGNEFEILLKKNKEEINHVASHPSISTAIMNMRSGNVKILPGYDGKFGVVDVLPKGNVAI